MFTLIAEHAEASTREEGGVVYSFGLGAVGCIVDFVFVNKCMCETVPVNVHGFHHRISKFTCVSLADEKVYQTLC